MIKTILEGLGMVLILLFIAVVILVAPFYFVNKLQCNAKYKDYKPQYGLSSGCRIEWNGKLTPVEMVRQINLD